MDRKLPEAVVREDERRVPLVRRLRGHRRGLVPGGPVQLLRGRNRHQQSGIRNCRYSPTVTKEQGFGTIEAAVPFLGLIFQVLQLADVHVIGHSLGGHVAGYVGKRVVEKAAAKLTRMTLLDPAAPMFEFSALGYMKPPWLAVSRDDAQFMDVVHTDAGQYGMKSPVGHVDFYPNGGVRAQPGCKDSEGNQ